jgi:hypothetical protein
MMAAVGRILLFACILLASCSRTADNPAEESKAAPVRITQFYSNKPTLPKGESALLCYGVENAAKVSIDPPVEQLTPSISRCFEVKPSAATTYTLTAEGKGGDKITQSVRLELGAARAAGPRLYDLSINKTAVASGEQVSFCFKASNTAKVTGSPGEFLRKGNPNSDCLMDKPTRTTTYTITAIGPDGQTDSASQAVTVK